MRKLLMLLALVACPEPGDERPHDGSDSADPSLEARRIPLSPEASAVRASMALRGIRPTPDELQRVAETPEALDELVDTWLDDPRFGATVRDLYAEAILMRSVELRFPQLGPHLTTAGQDLARAVQEEPLALIERVVTEGMPFTEVVTADWTVLDRVASTVWSDHDFDPDGPDVQVVSHTDGRPAAGVLSTNALWARHPSNGSNYHRGRADVIADVFLCEDFLDRDVPITGEVDLSDDAAVAEAVSTRPECVSCHQALDPLAAHLWGFFPVVTPGSVGASYLAGCANPVLDQCYPFSPWRPELEIARPLLGLRPPGYYGQATGDLADLGAEIAGDPRFAACTARRFWSYFAQVPASEAPFEIVARLQQRFTESGFDARDLAHAVVTHPDFLALEALDPALAHRVAGPLIARPEQHANLVEDLTGFRWVIRTDDLVCQTTGLTCYGDVDLALDDVFGVRAMTGGIDGARVTRPTHTPTPVKLLWAAALAEEAAGLVVRRELVQGLPPGVLTRLTPETAGDPTTVRHQLTDLLERVLGVAPGGVAAEEVDAAVALWEDAYARSGDAREAWRATLSALLQSPDILFY